MIFANNDYICEYFSSYQKDQSNELTSYARYDSLTRTYGGAPQN